MDDSTVVPEEIIDDIPIVEEGESGLETVETPIAGEPTYEDSLVEIASQMLGFSREEAKDILDNDADFKKHLMDSNPNKSGEVDQNGDAATSKEGKGTEKEADVNSGKPEGTSAEYADNVIEGISGEVFGKLPVEVQESLGSFYTKANEAQSQLAEKEEKLQKLLNDPLISGRAAMLEKGIQEYNPRGLNAEEKSTLINQFKAEFGFDDAEAAKAIQMIGSGVETIAKDMAKDLANNQILTSEKVRKQEQTTIEGRKLFLGLSEFNKSLELKETDITKFYSGVNSDGSPIYNSKHPEIEKFKNGVEKVMTHCRNVGINYEQALKLGKKGLYAVAASALDLPIAMNTKDRDTKIAMQARSKAVAPFLKTNSTGTLNTESQSSVPNTKAASIAQHGGYDIERLATDSGYRQKAMESSSDPKHIDKIVALTEKGRANLSKK